MTQLTSGIQAPNFKTKDIFNTEISLESLKGKKVMVSFYRYASCPLCNLRVNQLINKYPEWNEKGLEMIAIFQSPTESIQKYVGKHDSPFPIIPDPKQKLYKKYKVTGSLGKFLIGLKPSKLFSAAKIGFLPGKMENDITMIPADFIIDENGIIHTAYYGKDSSDHIDIQAVDRFLNLAV